MKPKMKPEDRPQFPLDAVFREGDPITAPIAQRMARLKANSKRGTFEVQPRRALEGRTRPLRPEEVSRLYAVRGGRPPKVT